MTLPPDPLRAGMTLFEVLIALAILSMVTAVVVINRPTPSAQLVLQSEISRLMGEAALARQKAVAGNADFLWSPNVSNCQDDVASIIFFSDGTARGTDICLEQDGQFQRLRIEVLSGRLVRVET